MCYIFNMKKKNFLFLMILVLVILSCLAIFYINKNNQNKVSRLKITSEEQIKNLLFEKNPESKEYYEYHSLTLKTLGEDYALMTHSRQGGGMAGLIVNLKTGDSEYIDGDYGFTINNMSIFFDSNKIYYYKTNSANADILPNSELVNKNETYNSWGDIGISPREIHTDESVTIDVFDLNNTVGTKEEGNLQYKKIRTETLYFPQ